MDGKREEIDSQLYLPRLLYLRMSRRNNLKGTSIICIFYNFFLLVIGFFLLDGAWTTRSYIGNGDAFWDIFKVKAIGDNEIQMYAAFSGIFAIFLSGFNWMNLGVILYHAHFGGLRIRLAFAHYIYLAMNALMFIWSIVPIAKFVDLITLFPAYLALNIGNLILTIVFIILSTKVVRKELEYMLPFELMRHHKDEYYQEYLTKKLALINVNHVAKNEEREVMAGQLEKENDRIFIKN